MSEKVVKIQGEELTPVPGECGACVFYSPLDKAQGFGECRESPPRVLTLPIRTMQGDSIQPIAVFPQVPIKAWCGAYEARDDEKDDVSDH